MQYSIDKQGQIYLGDTALGDRLATQAEIDAHDLAQEKQKKISELAGICSAMCQGDFVSNALGVDYTYPSKFPMDQFNLLTQCTDAINNPNDPAGFDTMCMSPAGVWGYVNHNAAQIKQVGDTNRTRILAIRKNYAAKVVQIMAATTVAAVNAVIW